MYIFLVENFLNFGEKSSNVAMTCVIESNTFKENRVCLSLSKYCFFLAKYLT